MTLIVPPGFASVIHSLLLTGDPEPFAVTYGVELDTAVTATPNEIAEACGDAFGLGPLQQMPTILSVLQTEVSIAGPSVGDPPVIGIDTTARTGVGTSTALVPQNTCWLIHKRTAMGGRSGRGRCYLPCVNEADVDAVGSLASARVSAMTGSVTTWLNALGTGDGLDGMVVLHDSNGAGALFPPTPVTSMSCDPRVATQRRRLRR